LAENIALAQAGDKLAVGRAAPLMLTSRNSASSFSVAVVAIAEKG